MSMEQTKYRIESRIWFGLLKCDTYAKHTQVQVMSRYWKYDSIGQGRSPVKKYEIDSCI